MNCEQRRKRTTDERQPKPATTKRGKTLISAFCFNVEFLVIVRCLQLLLLPRILLPTRDSNKEKINWRRIIYGSSVIYSQGRERSSRTSSIQFSDYRPPHRHNKSLRSGIAGKSCDHVLIRKLKFSLLRPIAWFSRLPTTPQQFNIPNEAANTFLQQHDFCFRFHDDFSCVGFCVFCRWFSFFPPLSVLFSTCFWLHESQSRFLISIFSLLFFLS